MSIAVAVQKSGQIVLATDSQTSFGGSRVPADNLTTKKVHHVGEAYLATTGWGLYENILDDFLAKQESIELSDKKTIFEFFLRLWKDLHNEYPFVKDQCDKDDDSPFGSLDASFLVVAPGGIFHVGSDMSVTQFMKYYAVGSGADYALGAISAVLDSHEQALPVAQAAVRAAIDFDLHCSGEVACYQVAAKIA